MTSAGFPDGRRFAFTILDDTDDFSLTAHRPIYLGDTLENPSNRGWRKGLAGSGCEIPFHGASMASSPGSRTLAAIAELEQTFPDAMRVHCDHGEDRENLYLGVIATRGRPPLSSRESTLAARVGRPWTGTFRHRSTPGGRGQGRGGPRVRSLTFDRLDCSPIPPGRPFRDPRRPLVSCWFNTADASAVNQFRRLVAREAVEDPAANGGWSIVSTQLGKGFVQDGRVDPAVGKILRFIAAQDGWLVPVSPSLDCLDRQTGSATLTTSERVRGEILHMWDRSRT